MNAKLKRFASAQVLVVGDLMLDEYVVGAVSRICPEAPVPVLDVRSRYSSAGGAANVAVNVARLGAQADLVGLIGQDGAGRQLRDLLRRNSVNERGLVESSRGTTSKTRIVAGQQQICRIDSEITEEIEGALAAEVVGAAKGLLEDCSVVVLSDYAKGMLTERVCREVIAIARTSGKPVIVDPKSRDLRRYRGCSVLTPNQAEAALAANVAVESEETLHRVGAVLLNELPGAGILITRGSEGMALFQNGREPAIFPAVARRVFDVVGAGDTAVATLAVANAAGLPLEEAVVWANISAGLVVEKQGTAAVTLEELAENEGAASWMVRQGAGRSQTVSLP